MRYVGLAGLYRGALQQHHVPEQGTCTNVAEQYCVLYKRGQPCTNGTFYHPCTNHGQDFHQCVLYKIGQPCTIHFQTIYKNTLCTIQERPAMYHPCTNHVPCTKIALVCTIEEGPTMYHPSEKECVTRNSREYKLIHRKLFFLKIKLKV